MIRYVPCFIYKSVQLKKKHNYMWGNAQVSYKAGAVKLSKEERDGTREEREEK